MINRNLSKKEKNLFKILAIGICFLVLKLFVVDPINLKIIELKNTKQNIINLNNSKRDSVDNHNNEIEEDIVLVFEKELKNFINIDYINKKMVYDENNNDTLNVEIKVSGSLEQIFRIQETINKLELNKNIKYMQISQTPNIEAIDEEDNEEKEREPVLDCIMEINVG